MSYVPANISPAGLSIPTYNDILQLLVSKFQGIYGADTYLGTDSLDYQFLSAIALAVSDSTNGVQLSYGNRSVAFAIGTGLDGLVALCNIVRKSATNSTVELTVSGDPFTLIPSGQARDIAGNLWVLPNPSTIDSTGSISVTATAIDPGPIAANPGDVKYIATPTAGWVSVTNPAAAIPGLPVETDSQLRARQALSVSIPAIGPVSSLIATVAAVSGVTRLTVHENATGGADGFGAPAHSLLIVVEGGTDLAIAQAIFAKRMIGAQTVGSTTVDITDASGYSIAINFSRAAQQQIYVTVRLAVLNSSTYNSGFLAKVQAAILAYLLALPVAGDSGVIVSQSILESIAVSQNPSLSTPTFDVLSLFLGTHPSPVGTGDITLPFGYVALSQASWILVSL